MQVCGHFVQLPSLKINFIFFCNCFLNYFNIKEEKKCPFKSFSLSPLPLLASSLQKTTVPTVYNHRFNLHHRRRRHHTTMQGLHTYADCGQAEKVQSLQ